MILLVAPGIIEISIAVVVGFLITFAITRWMFRINTIADNLKLQTRLLITIAKHNKVPPEEINKLISPDNDSYPAAVGSLETVEHTKTQEA